MDTWLLSFLSIHRSHQQNLAPMLLMPLTLLRFHICIFFGLGLWWSSLTRTRLGKTADIILCFSAVFLKSATNRSKGWTFGFSFCIILVTFCVELIIFFNCSTCCRCKYVPFQNNSCVVEAELERLKCTSVHPQLCGSAAPTLMMLSAIWLQGGLMPCLTRGQKPSNCKKEINKNNLKKKAQQWKTNHLCPRLNTESYILQLLF